ncbi:MAG TPA: DUF883 C-terminal domain-containing protein [Verrucomicrobiae bacterium]|jgi:hypothetical protein|nr:DUF883 C-terminal domain-containing protein [Verrucomicrobiae bacterium]
MSELSNLLNSRRKYSKEWKIVAWTLGMAIGVYLITDGKTISEHPLQHLVIGAALGLVLGYLFSRNLQPKSSTK